MLRDNKTNVLLVIAGVILTEWRFLPFTGPQGILIGLLPSYKFNVLFGAFLAVALFAKKGHLKASTAWSIIFWVTFAPFLLNILFKDGVTHSPNSVALIEWFPFLPEIWKTNQIVMAIIGPGLMHGVVHILSFFLTGYSVLVHSLRLEQPIGSTLFSSYPEKGSTRWWFLWFFVLWGFVTGAYWAYFSDTWGSWFNSDPIEIFYLSYLLLLTSIAHSQGATRLYSYIAAHFVGASLLYLTIIRVGVVDTKHAETIQAIEHVSDFFKYPTASLVFLVSFFLWCLVYLLYLKYQQELHREDEKLTFYQFQYAEILSSKYDLLRVYWSWNLVSFFFILFMFFTWSGGVEETKPFFLAVVFLNTTLFSFFTVYTINLAHYFREFKNWTASHFSFFLFFLIGLLTYNGVLVFYFPYCDLSEISVIVSPDVSYPNMDRLQGPWYTNQSGSNEKQYIPVNFFDAYSGRSLNRDFEIAITRLQFHPINKELPIETSNWGDMQPGKVNMPPISTRTPLNVKQMQYEYYKQVSIQELDNVFNYFISFVVVCLFLVSF